MGKDVMVQKSGGELVDHAPTMQVPQPPPSSYTFDQLVRMANSFAKSGLFGVKDPDSALALLMIAHGEGRSPALIMRDFDIIGGRLAKKSEAMLRDFQESGGRVKWIELSDVRAKAEFSHPLAPNPITIDWDMDRAKKAGLSTKAGDMYAKYARAMLRSRCISEGVRSTAPGATSQAYTPEEIRAIASETVTAVSENIATHDAGTSAKTPMPESELEALINSMDVGTVDELIVAFGHAYTRAKEAGDENAKRRLKVVYDDMKMALESPPVI